MFQATSAIMFTVTVMPLGIKEPRAGWSEDVSANTA